MATVTNSLTPKKKKEKKLTYEEMLADPEVEQVPDIPEDEWQRWAEIINQEFKRKEKKSLTPKEVLEIVRSSLVTPKPWTPQSRRCGVIARKLGMMQLFDQHGRNHPVTVLYVDDCQVVQIKEEALNKLGEIRIQLGAGYRRPAGARKSLLGHFARAGLEPKRKLAEFKITPDAVLPIGTTLHARHFIPGQFVDLQGITRGKGFAGVMKRWGFKGQPATHGVSLTHRSLGATGSRQDPGKVFKGKKMPGRVGGERNTKQNVQILKIDVPRDLLFVKGAVPGAKDNFVLVKDAIKKRFDPAHPPPFPTFVPLPNDNVKELFAPAPKVNPFARE